MSNNMLRSVSYSRFKPQMNKLVVKLSQNLLILLECAKYIALSVLETSLPMQRSHETLTLDISA